LGPKNESRLLLAHSMTATIRRVGSVTIRAIEMVWRGMIKTGEFRFGKEKNPKCMGIGEIFKGVGLVVKKVKVIKRNDCEYIYNKYGDLECKRKTMMPKVPKISKSIVCCFV
jgi:hypothetical protein